MVTAGQGGGGGGGGGLAGQSHPLIARGAITSVKTVYGTVINNAVFLKG